MTCDEFSNEFDILLSSYRRFINYDNKQALDSIQFDEYEKSVFLTQAQESVVIALYNGSLNGQTFENTEESRSYINQLIRQDSLEVEDGFEGVTNYSKSVVLPDEVWFIVYEHALFDDDGLGCLNGSRGSIKPVTHDTVYPILRNPFKGANNRRVLRLTLEDNTLELISRYNISEYFVRYLVKPTPIILTNLGESDQNIGGISQKTECELNTSLHRAILEKAVQIALASLGAGSPNIV